MKEAGPGFFELEDKPMEECGVFGIYSPGQPVAELTRDALFVLQHRGQEGAGISVSDGTYLTTLVDEGLVSEAFRGDRLAGMKGNIASGHVRYGTLNGGNALQPMMGKSDAGLEFVLSHNGHIANFDELLLEGKVEGDCATDSKLISRLINQELNQGGLDLVTAITAAGNQLIGAYTLVIMTPEKLYGVRDPNGFRPLVLGELDNNGWVLASEKAALDIVGADFVREIERGEIVEIDNSGVNSYSSLPKAEPRLCGFEFVYFSRPDAKMEGENVARARIRMGNQLAKEHPAPEADIVIGVPDSGSLAGMGYSEGSGLPFVEGGLIKNRYVGRSFIQATQADRGRAVRMKFNANPEFIEGKSIVLIDDSIVRGTTTQAIVEMLLDAGAGEVHLRISSAPYRWPCFYGMNTGDRRELIAASMGVDEICKKVGANSLGYLSIEGLKAAIGPIAGEKVCLACMTRDYPTKINQELLKINGSPD